MPDAFTVSTTTRFNDNLVKLVRANLLSKLRGGLANGPKGAIDSESSYSSGHLDEYVLPGLGDLQVALNPLDEVISPEIEDIESYLVSFTTTEYARSIGFSSKLLRQQPFNAAAEIAERVSRNAAETADEILRLMWQAAHAGEKVIGTGVAALKTDDLINGVAYLQNKDVPPLANGYYGLITSPLVVADLKREVGEKSWNAANLQDNTDLVAGSLGKWHGVEFFGSSRNTPASGTTVVSILVGANAAAFADASSLQTFTVLPQASESDPVAQRGIVSWRAIYGATPITRKVRHDDTAVVYSHLKFNSLLTTV